MAEETISRRRLIPLQIISNESPFTTETRLHKLVFITQAEYLGESPYEFYAFDYGPRSDDLMESISSSVEQGIIREDNHNSAVYELTDTGERLLSEVDQSEEHREAAQSAYEEYGDMRVRQILDYIYAEYDEWVKASPYS